MSIKSETVNGVARIELARPEKKNAITSAMYASIVEALEKAESDPAVRAILFHGQRDLFTAGNDLEDFMHNPPSGDTSQPILQFLTRLAAAEKPVVAAVNGLAVGVGTTMLYHCDLVYVASDARLSMPFVTLGLCPEFASSLLVSLHAGYHKAAEKLLLGDPISADEAVDMRIANRALPPDEVLPFAIGQAERFNALPPTAVRESKRLMKLAWKGMIDKAMGAEFAAFSPLLRGPEAKEAFTAFFERRKPDFSVR